MRILMASHGYPPIVSGVTYVVQKLARAMVKRGHSVTVITGTDRDEEYETDDQGVHVVRQGGIPNPWWKETVIPYIGYKELQRLVEAFRPDLLHVHEAGLLALACIRLKRETQLPALSTAYYVPRFAARYLSPGDQPRSSIEAVVWAYTTWVFDQFDHVVFATEAHRRIFVRQGLDVPTTIISNGLDITRYCPAGCAGEDFEFRRRLPPRPRILFVSRLMRDKEIDVLVRAMPYVGSEQAAHLLIAGRGDDRPHLEKLVDEMELRHCVHFLGFVPEEDMPALYRACDLFAIASQCEVQSLPTLQALATGLPVVAVNAVALPEIVRDGVNGLLVPPADPEAMAEAMLRILADRQMAHRMGQAGLEIVRAHDERLTFDQYEALYAQMIDGR